MREKKRTKEKEAKDKIDHDKSTMTPEIAKKETEYSPIYAVHSYQCAKQWKSMNPKF
jgi:hypothetical protein